MSSPSNPYWALLRDNPNYRNLWSGQVASLLGDWLNTIALYTLVRELTGSPLALGLVFITKMLPFALASPLAGWLTDRFDRRRLMIGADLVRAVIVLGFLFVDTAGDLPLLYLLAAAQISVGAVFIPARSASIPNITSDDELVTANALSSATWSVLLALGAALGGLATSWLGTSAVFLLDSATYLVSALFIWRTVIPQHTGERAAPGLRSLLAEIVDGWRHVVRRPAIRRMVLAKPAWALGGGALVYMLALLGERAWPADPAVGIGLLYAARGLGTGIGPIAARRFLPDPGTWPLMLGLAIASSGLLYAGVPFLSAPWAMVGLVILAHAPSGANWVFSTVLLQRRTVDAFRGRVFSTEWLVLMLVETATILAAAALLEYARWPLGRAILLFAAIELGAGLVWLATVVPAERRGGEAETGG